MNADIGVQIDIVGGLRRRIGLIALIAGTVFLVTYWIAMALPNQYAAFATLLVEPQQVTETAGGRSLQTAQDVNDRLHLMTATLLSRPRLSRVIDELALYEEESLSMTRQEVIDLMRDKLAVTPVLPELEAGLRLSRELDINTFRIHFESEVPATAAAVAQRLANDFIEEHISQRVKLTQKSLDFITTEQTRVATAMRQMEEQIASVKEQNPGKLPEDLQAYHRQMDRVMVRLANAERDLDIARSDASFYESQSLEAAFLTGSTNDETSPTRRLAALELQLSALKASGLTDKHPDVIFTEAEMASLKQQIALESGEGPDEGDPPTLAQRQLQAEKERALLKVATAEAEIRRLESEADELRASIDQMPAITDRIESLEQRRKEMADSLREFNKRALETSTLANLERKQLGEQFRIIEPAFAPIEPKSPNRVVIMIIGAVMGLSLGLAAAVVIEATDSSLHGARELQSVVGVPVLVAIPSIMLDADRRTKRRRRYQTVAAAVVVTVFCLLGGLITNRIVNAPPAAPAEAAEETAQAAPGLLERRTG